MRKVIALVGFIALMAMMGIAAASFTVEIINPADGAVIPMGSEVSIGSSTSAFNENTIYSRGLINGVPITTALWIPTEPGEYTITAEVANNPQYTNSVTDSITVTVLAASVNKRIKAVNELFTGISRTEDTYIDAPGILANDIGQGLSVYEPESIVLSDPSKGQIYVEADGSFVFSPADGVRKGYVLFYYKVTDGNLISNIGTAKLSLV